MKSLFKTALLCLALAISFTWRAAAAEPGTTVYLVGDSTMCDYVIVPGQPQRGWGQMLHLCMKEGVKVDNHAMGGRSSKSFITEGRWKKVLSLLKEGDYVIIQFGHNDEKKEDPKRFTEPFGTFDETLAGYLKDIREHKAHPMLVTPVSRRSFDTNGKINHSHGNYAVAVRQLAEKEKVPLLDLEARTSEELEKMGPERSKSWFMWIPAGEFPNQPEAKEDNTHFNSFGASRVCDLAVLEIQKNAPDLAKWIQEGRVDPLKR